MQQAGADCDSDRSNYKVASVTLSGALYHTGTNPCHTVLYFTVLQ
jgi:phosphoribosyl-AMP cyclohydrolase